MKKFISKIQSLSERAAELQAAVKSAPPKFAELREAVALTTGQLQQLRADVEQGIGDLKADNDVQVIDSLREINSSVLVFQQAGYELSGVDVELSPLQRLIVHLHRVEDVHSSALRSLLSSNEHRKVTHALLRSLIQAEDMADQVDLDNLVYHKLIVNVGPIPAVRLCWRSENEDLVAEQTVSPKPVSAAAPAAASHLDSYGKGSFFGNPGAVAAPSRPAATPRAEPVETAPVAMSPAPAATVTETASPTTGRQSHRSGGRDWGASSLERFKTMPSVSKYRR